MKRERHALSWNMEKGFVNLYFERYLYPYLSSSNGVVKRGKMDHMGVFTLMPSCSNIIRWYLWVQNININSGKGSRSKVYPLGIIRSSAGFSKQLQFLFPCIKFIPDWWVSKWRKGSDGLIFISNSTLRSLHGHMKHSAFLHSSLCRVALAKI